MCENEVCKNWYALFVSTGHEDIVKKRLEDTLDSSFEILIPKRSLRERKSGIWRQVTRTLFPGYILIQGTIDTDNYIKIKQTTGIIKVLENHGEPLIIHNSEIEVISRLTSNDEIIGSSSVLIEGKKIKVINGPLLSCEGLIESVNKRKGRVKVKLSFFGELRTVELSVDVVEPSAGIA